MVKFYKDNFNARFTWGWVDGEFTTDDSALIENYKGLGLRCEDIEEVKEEVIKPKRRGRKPKKIQDFVENEVIPALNDAQDRGVK